MFYLDHNYLENMLAMFRKVNAKERIVGWYSSGPKICPADIAINSVFQRYTETGSTAASDTGRLAEPHQNSIETRLYPHY